MKLTNNLKIVKNNFNKSLPSHLKDLNTRSKEIFSLIVDDFLKTGNPVGSRKLSFKMGEQLSPASIRNVMYDLQESGLLKSNHTSAGRVPTDLGLRFFVDGLLQVGRIKNNECEEIKKTLNNDQKNIEDLCNNASELLSGLSDCAGIVVAPKIGGRLKHIEFVPVSNDKALVILVTENGMIENRIIKIPKGLPSSLLIETTNYLNSITKGKSLFESKKLIKEQIKSDKIRIDKASRKLIDEGFACWDDATKKSKLIVTGTSKLL